MTQLAESAIVRWRPVWLLALSQALFFTALSIVFTVAGLVGVWLAPSPALATIPLGVTGVFTAATALLAVKGFAHFGRQPVFIFGAMCGLVGALLAVLAIHRGSFVGFCLATGSMGIFQGIAQYYRLAAADVAPSEADRPRAISWVMAGGLAAAFVGPYLGALAKDVMIVPFAGSYAVSAAVSLLAIGALAFWREPEAARMPPLPDWTPALNEFNEKPALRHALAYCVAAWAMMVLTMNAAPLAVVGCGLPVTTAASVVQWHLVGMFAPSFFTGNLIARYGAQRVAQSGCWLGVVACALTLGGETSPYFHAAMIGVGIGWNFAFIGGSALLVAAASATNRGRLQSINETSTFVIVTLAAFSAGFAQDAIGWSGVGIAGIVLLLPAMFPALIGARRSARA